MDPGIGRRILLTLVVVIIGYGLFLPLWLVMDRPWAALVAATATSVTLPATGLRGAVQLQPGESITLRYILPDARTGKWGSARQRLLNFPDVPLALAFAFGLLGISWRRRLVVAGAALATAFLAHALLVTASAHAAAAILARPELAPAEVDRQVTGALGAANQFGDLSPVGLLVLVALLGRLLRPAPVRPEPVRPPAAPSGGGGAT